MAQDTRSVSTEFRDREPHKPTVHVRVDALIVEDTLRRIVREEFDIAIREFGKQMREAAENVTVQFGPGEEGGADA